MFEGPGIIFQWDRSMIVRPRSNCFRRPGVCLRGLGACFRRLGVRLRGLEACFRRGMIEGSGCIFEGTISMTWDLGACFRRLGIHVCLRGMMHV